MKSSKDKGVKFLTGLTRVGQVPKLKPHEILVMPEHDSLLDSDIISPIINKNYDDWWIDNLDSNRGIVHCPGVTDVMHTGITLRLWGDLRCRPSPDGMRMETEFNISSSYQNQSAGSIEPFEFEATGACPYTDRRDESIKRANYVKLVTPFYIRTAKGYSSMISGSHINPRPEFDVVTGMVNTDYYHTINVVMNVLTDKPFYVAQGTPIAQIIVFKRNDNIKTLLWGDENLYRAHRGRGFGGPWVPLNGWRKGKYKREQRRWDR